MVRAGARHLWPRRPERRGSRRGGDLRGRPQGRYAMSRQGERERSGARGPVYDPDIPTTGCYEVTLRKGAPTSAVRIWLGPSIDPATGEEGQERGWFWQCELN